MKMECQGLYNIKRCFAVLLSFILCLSLSSCVSNEKNIKDNTESKLDNFIVFFETDDDADSALISANGVNIMVDTGEKKDAKEIAKQLEKWDINKLDYLIFSHFDKDHIGGALKLLEIISVDKILHPSYVKNSEESEKLMKIINEKEISNQAITKNDSIEIKGIRLSFIPAVKDSYLEKESNNSSLVVKAEIDGVSALFTGDCQEERVEELLSSDNNFSADILKLMYHGREVKNEEKFIERVKPRYTVITAEEKKKTKQRIEKFDLGEIFFNENGNIFFEISNSSIIAYQE